MTCAHEQCTCAVEGSTHCSDYCEQQMSGGGGGEPCQCGHPDCIGTPG
ncbi:MAG TPA: hypothetical protein VJ938_01715 [Acidimicrobiia bacterium]|nr:hypothetical protein [Acidimicrobiia bacterium]